MWNIFLPYEMCCAWKWWMEIMSIQTMLIATFKYLYFSLFYPGVVMFTFWEIQPSTAYIEKLMRSKTSAMGQKYLVSQSCIQKEELLICKHRSLDTSEIPIVILMVCCLPLRSDGASRRMSAQQDVLWKRRLRLITSLWMCCSAETHFLWP